jgi:hypothetical protein
LCDRGFLWTDVDLGYEVCSSEWIMGEQTFGGLCVDGVDDEAGTAVIGQGIS